MKTCSRIIVTLPLLAGMAFIPAISQASETRVAATGGLSTVLPDETTDLNLFLDGNPAGLVYLNSRSRLDFSAHWVDSDQEGPWGSARNHHWQLLSTPGGNAGGYEGLMLFPSSYWAFQAAGMMSGAGGTASPVENRYQGLLRACYALSFGSIGVEILASQTDGTLVPDPLIPAVEFLSGTASQNQMLVKTGVAAVFPSSAPPDEPRWQAGAFIALPLGTQGTRQTASLSETAPSPIFLGQTITNTLYHSSGVELIYEVPNSLKIECSAALLDDSYNFEQTTSSPSTIFGNFPAIPILDFHSGNLDGSFRYSLPLNGDQNLKCGGSLGLHWKEGLLQGGLFRETFQQQQWSLLLGVGFEEVKEYTMGLQWKSRQTLSAGTSLPLAIPSLPSADNLYQLAFGGERWLSPAWALRLGLAVEQDDAFTGNLHTLTTSIRAGAGWEGVLGRMDLGLNLGQTLDTGNSSNTLGLFSAELSSTIFL